ncbi:MAG: hypothetical protein LC647_01660 [Beggiatoa sp.]|nr:hypothetical protein [Beggiatoa sp.]
MALGPGPANPEVYKNAGGRWLLLGVFENEDEVAALPFDAIAFNLGGLWAD